MPDPTSEPACTYGSNPDIGIVHIIPAPIAPPLRHVSKDTLITSTPVADCPSDVSFGARLGQDGLLSPITSCAAPSGTLHERAGPVQGDDHPRTQSACEIAHDGQNNTSVDDRLTHSHSAGAANYRHPCKLAVDRATHWPAPAALGDHYSDLAYVYSVVKSTGVPNSLSARLKIQSRLNVPVWHDIATGHSDDIIVLDGITYGFLSQYWGPPRPSTEAGYNHVSAVGYPRAVGQYIKKELDEGALLGPFKEPPFEWVHYSPMMTRPKPGSDGERRVIVDLSFPPGEDINSCITKNIYNGKMFSHTLPTVDDLVNIIRALDYQVYIYSIDIARAYQNFRSDPLDWPLQGISFAGDLLIDSALPFRERNSSFFMQKVAEFISRALTTSGACVLIYLDDIVGVAHTEGQAWADYNKACELLGDLGLPLANKKLNPPTRSLKWLGIACDIDNRTLSIPELKVQETLETIASLYQRSAMSRSEVQQLAGRINFVSRVCRPARLFMARILSYLRAHPVGYTKISNGARADMRWFLDFLPGYNGISMIPEGTPSVVLEADSCMVGGGAFCGQVCYSFTYPTEMSATHHISQLEAINCMAAIRACVSSEHAGRLVLVKCDNSAAVSIYHTGKGRDTVILACARAIWAHAARCDCSLAFKHVPGELMGIADTLSRAPLSYEHDRKAKAMCSEMGLIPFDISANAFDYSSFL